MTDENGPIEARFSLGQLKAQEQMLLEFGELTAAAKVRSLRIRLAQEWDAHTVKVAQRQAQPVTVVQHATTQEVSGQHVIPWRVYEILAQVALRATNEQLAAGIGDAEQLLTDRTVLRRVLDRP